MKAISLEPVSSSNIEAIGYGDGLLIIEFKDGDRYSYSGVSQETFDELRTAPSVGRFFHLHIRDKYATTKLWSK